MPVAERTKITYQDIKKAAGKPVVKFFSDDVLRAVDPLADGYTDEKPRIKFTVSTTAVDLVSDVMQKTALQRLAQGFVGMTAFMNHNYEVPGSVMGTIEKTELVEREFTNNVDGKTASYLCLDTVFRVAASNPKAVKTYELIKDDAVKLGASISVIISDSTSGPDGTQLIHDCYPLEISIVGIPAERNSWAQAVSKAFKDFEREQRKQEQVIPVPSDKPVAKQAAKPAAQAKDTKKMSKKSKRLVRKNAFDEIMSGHASATIGDLTQALATAIADILANADGGNTDGVKEALDSLFSDFEEACMTAIQPAVDAMEQEEPEDEADEDSDGVPDDQEGQDAADGSDDDEENDDEEDDAQKSLALAKVRAFLKMALTAATRKSRKASKDGAEDLVTTMDEDGNPYQDMHDYCVQKGAVCKEIDTPDANGISLSYRGGQSAKALQAQLKELKEENAQWEAIATEMREKLASYMRQPLPAGKK